MATVQALKRLAYVDSIMLKRCCHFFVVFLETLDTDVIFFFIIESQKNSLNSKGRMKIFITQWHRYIWHVA